MDLKVVIHNLINRYSHSLDKVGARNHYVAVPWSMSARTTTPTLSTLNPRFKSARNCKS